MELRSAGGSFSSASATSSKPVLGGQVVYRQAGPAFKAQDTKGNPINAQHLHTSSAARSVSLNQASPSQPFSQLETPVEKPVEQLVEKQQPSLLREAKAIFNRVEAGVSSAKAAAVSDRAKGISIADGLVKFKKDTNAATLFSLAGQVLAANGVSDPSASAAGAALARHTVSGAPTNPSSILAVKPAASSATHAKAGAAINGSAAVGQGHVIRFEQPSDGTPWTVAIDKFGQRAQALLQLQSQHLALDYLGKQTGLDLVNMPLSTAADKVFGWLAGGSISAERTAENRNAVGGTSAAGTTATAASPQTGPSAITGTLGVPAAGSDITSIINAVTGSGVFGATVAHSAGQTGNPFGVASAPEWGGAVLSAIGAAYSAYQLIDNWGQNTPAQGAVSGATIGAYIGTQVLPGVGTLVGAGIGGLLGAVAGMFGGHKHKDQLARDQMRGQLQQIGFIDQNFGVTLADGTSFDIGLDQGKRLQNIDGTERRPFEVDFSNTFAAQVVGWVQPLTKLLFPNDQKLKDDLTGYLTNAALSNAEDLEGARKNVMRFYDQLKLTPEKVVQGLQALGEQGSLTNDLPAYLNGVSTLLSGLAQPGSESKEGEVRAGESKDEAVAGKPDEAGQVSESVVLTQTAVA